MKSRARLVQFGISGVFTTVAYFLASNALHYGMDIPASTSSLLSYAMAVVLSYLLQSMFTFQTKKSLVAASHPVRSRNAGWTCCFMGLG